MKDVRFYAGLKWLLAKSNLHTHLTRREFQAVGAIVEPLMEKRLDFVCPRQCRLVCTQRDDDLELASLAARSRSRKHFPVKYPIDRLARLSCGRLGAREYGTTHVRKALRNCNYKLVIHAGDTLVGDSEGELHLHPGLDSVPPRDGARDRDRVLAGGGGGIGSPVRPPVARIRCWGAALLEAETPYITQCLKIERGIQATSIECGVAIREARLGGLVPGQSSGKGEVISCDI